MEIKRKHESLFWIAVWGVVFLIVPLTELGMLFSEDSAEAFHHVLRIWTGILPFLVLFLIHHIFLAPLSTKKLPLYIGLTVALLIVFAVFCESIGPNPVGPPLGQDVIFGPVRPQTMKALMGVLLVLADLGAFAYVEGLRNEQRMKALKAESVAQQLQALRYQISPHFFMNTLNNIHALVDIDSEMAKESIEEFSKMMRILLYEGDSPTIPLSREVDFIKHYISLMKLRYPEDKVKIENALPEKVVEASVPPLLLSSFVENAFKHGISYEADSFIRVGLAAKEGRVIFRCANSDHSADDQTIDGIGLDNIHKRLGLLYETDYTLQVDQSGGTYTVTLDIPAIPQNMKS